MDFLKEILGEDLFAQIAEKVNAHNEANKDKQIKIGNLGTGEYVGKAKFDALQELVNGKETELQSANELIAELKKGTKGNEALQQKISGYESQVADLQAQLQETKIKAAIKVALLSEKATDVDYLTFKLESKLKEENRTLELDENENIKGWDDMLSGLKVQCPTFFESSNGDGYEVLGDNRLKENGNQDKGLTAEAFNKMGYQSRLKLKNEQPDVYATMTGKANN